MISVLGELIFLSFAAQVCSRKHGRSWLHVHGGFTTVFKEAILGYRLHVIFSYCFGLTSQNLLYASFVHVFRVTQIQDYIELPEIDCYSFQFVWLYFLWRGNQLRLRKQIGNETGFESSYDVAITWPYHLPLSFLTFVLEVSQSCSVLIEICFKSHWYNGIYMLLNTIIITD